MGYLLRCLGLRFNPQQVETMVLEFDEDGSGGVELDELEKIIGQIVRISLSIKRNVKYQYFQQGVTLHQTDIDIVRLMRNP